MVWDAASPGHKIRTSDSATRQPWMPARPGPLTRQTPDAAPVSPSAKDAAAAPLFLAAGLGRRHERNGDRLRVHRLDLVALLDHLEVVLVLHFEVDHVAPGSFERNNALLLVNPDHVGQHRDLPPGRAGRPAPGFRARAHLLTLRVQRRFGLLEFEGKRLD